MVGLRKMLWVGACAATLAGAAATAQMHSPLPAAEAHFSAQTQATSFDLFRGSRIFLTGTINGVPTDMMLDSGAAMTVLDRAFADRMGIKGSRSIQVRGAAGEVPGQIASGITLEVAGLKLDKANLLIIDMGHIERAIGRKIPIVLGRDAFRAGIVTIDFPGRTIRFSERSRFNPPTGAKRIDLGGDGHLRSVKLSVSGLPAIDATLDIGNGGTILLANAYWTAQPKLASLRHAETQIGGVGGMKLARKVMLPEVEFAGALLTNVPAILNEDPTALPTRGGNLGIEMLKSFVVTIDDAGDAIYLQAAGQPAEFAKERAGLRTEHVGDRLKVAYVAPGGPAATAGLKPGDEIVAVNGRRIDADYYRIEPEWIRGKAGQAVELERADGRRVVVTLADYY